MPLAEYYAGDEAWQNFVRAHLQWWPSCRFKEELLLALRNDLPLAQAMYGKLGDDALHWLDQSVPALDGREPRSLLALKHGVLSVRECLMRMP
jgi:hypothetical protein